MNVDPKDRLWDSGKASDASWSETGCRSVLSEEIASEAIAGTDGASVGGADV